MKVVRYLSAGVAKRYISPRKDVIVQMYFVDVNGKDVGVDYFAQFEWEFEEWDVIVVDIAWALGKFC